MMTEAPSSADFSMSAAEGLELAHSVLPKVELGAIRMLGGSFSVGKGEVGAASRSQCTVQRVQRIDRAIDVVVEYLFDLSGPGKPGSDTDWIHVLIQAQFQAIYSIRESGTVSTQEAEAFGRLQAVFNTWPYVREFAQSCTARMQVPLLTLPLISASQAAELAGFKLP